MKAFVVGQRSDQAGFERELQIVADKFPDTEEGKEAVEIINQLNKKNLKVIQQKTKNVKIYKSAIVKIKIFRKVGKQK